MTPNLAPTGTVRAKIRWTSSGRASVATSISFGGKPRRASRTHPPAKYATCPWLRKWRTTDVATSTNGDESSSFDNLTTSIERAQVCVRCIDGSRQRQFQLHIDLSQGNEPLFFSKVDQWNGQFFPSFASAAGSVHKNPPAGIQRWVFSKI